MDTIKAFNIKKYFKLHIAVAALLLLAAGCGGGGGGAAAPAPGAAAKSAGVNLNVSLPRSAAGTLGGDPVLAYDAVVEIIAFDASGAGQTVASDEAVVTYNQETDKYAGSFFVTHIPEGSNYIVKISLFAAEAGEGGVIALKSIPGEHKTVSAQREAGAPLTAQQVFIGALVRQIFEEETSLTVVDPASTVTALVVMRFAMTRTPAVALSDTDVVSPTIIDQIRAEVEAQIGDSRINTDSLLFGGADPFIPTDWNDDLAGILDQVLASTDLSGADTVAPQIVALAPGDGDSGIAYDGPSFDILFSEPMDTTVDLNDTAILAGSGYEIVIEQADDPQWALTLNSSNMLQYGDFTWLCQGGDGSALCLRWFDNQTLDTAQLPHLQPATTYNISLRTIPAQIRDAAGNPPAPATIATTGTFTTAASTDDTTAPQLVAITPAHGETNVSAEATVFTFTFSESLRTNVNLNAAADLAQSGFSVTLTDVQSSFMVTLDSTNALSYGTFSRAVSANGPNSVIAFTMHDSATLLNSALTPLAEGRTYSITSLSLPGTLKDLAGNPLDIAHFPTLPAFTTAVTPAETFARVAPLTGYEYASTVAGTTDGGLVAAGYTSTSGGARKLSRAQDRTANRSAKINIQGSNDGFVMKLNAAGTVEWTSVSGGALYDEFHSVIQTPDGGYLAAGSSYSFSQNGDQDGWAVKYDAAGNVAWENSYGSTGYEHFIDVMATSDGGYVFVGSSDSFAQNGYTEIWLVKTDSAGTPVWSQTYGQEFNYYYARAAAMTPDGGFLVAGEASYQISYRLVMKFDAAGNLVTETTLNNLTQGTVYDIADAGDGTFVIAGFSYGVSPDYFTEPYLARVDSGANVTWEVTHAGLSVSRNIYGVAVLPGGDIVAVGNEYDPQLGMQPGIVSRYSSTGAHLSDTHIGGDCYDFARSAAVLSDGGFAVSGGTMTFNTDNAGEDVLLLKFSPSGAAPDLSGLVHSMCIGGQQN